MIRFPGLLQAVRDTVDENGRVAFQNSVGTNVKHFLGLLKWCLSSTYVAFEDTLVIQKK